MVCSASHISQAYMPGTHIVLHYENISVMIHASVKLKHTSSTCISPIGLGEFYIYFISDYFLPLATISESNLISRGVGFIFLKTYCYSKNKVNILLIRQITISQKLHDSFHLGLHKWMKIQNIQDKRGTDFHHIILSK